MLNKRISKKYKIGDSVYLLVGNKEYKGKVYTIKSINFDRVTLDGYQTRKKTKKITQENTENYSIVDIPIHISNIVGVTEQNKPSRIGFLLDVDGKKIRILRKTNAKY